MKRIGLLGGMSWESSAEYYRIINQETRRRLGGTHSAPSVMYSVDFAEVEALQEDGEWGMAAALMVEAARRIGGAGADCLVICTNTMHRLAAKVESAIGIPLLHIADASAKAVTSASVSRVALLGTRYTMEQPFYRGRLEERHGLDVLVPEEPERTMIHEVIFGELVRGEVRDEPGRDTSAPSTRSSHKEPRG